MPNGWGRKGGKGKGKGWGGAVPHHEFQQVIDSYLQPLLIHSIQNTLSELSDALLRRLWQSAERRMPMRFYVSAKVAETNLIVSSTDDTDASSCAVGGERDEPIVGVAFASKTTVFSNHVNGCSVIFNLAGERLGQVSSGFPALLKDEKPVAKWVYANPILEVPDNLSPDAQIIGILGVEGNDDKLYGVFTNNVFQKEVKSISCEVGQYLSVLSSLRQVDRL
ncbi:MAG: hypothetical protein ACHBNF_14250 [Chromatiales bacterium]